MRLARLGFACLTATWLLLLLMAPGAYLGVPLSGLAYAFGALICHQRAERSFFMGAAQWPVCARCSGLYLGAAAAAVAAIAAPRVVVRTLVEPFGLDGLRFALLVSALPTAITWVAEAAGLWAPSNMTRFVAALPLGVAVALTVNYGECARRLRSESRRPPTLT